MRQFDWMVVKELLGHSGQMKYCKVENVLNSALITLQVEDTTKIQSTKINFC